jgi:hypothetical protein
MNFHDNEGFKISARLSKRCKLIDIANDMERRLTMNLLNDNSQVKVGIDTTLSSYTVLTQMVRSGEKLLNDFIIFLTVLPQGLCLTEAKIVLKMIHS